MAPREPQEAVGGSLWALLGLSWGYLGALLGTLLAPQTLVLLRQNYRSRKRMILFTKYHVKLTVKKPLSSSSKMYTILARELQNESAGRIFPLFRHLTHDDNMACTFQNISFTEAKP